MPLTSQMQAPQLIAVTVDTQGWEGLWGQRRLHPAKDILATSW